MQGNGNRDRVCAWQEAGCTGCGREPIAERFGEGGRIAILEVPDSPCEHVCPHGSGCQQAVDIGKWLVARDGARFYVSKAIETEAGISFSAPQT